MHILLILAALLFSPHADKPDCRQIEAITGGVELAWLGYPDGWQLPDDLKRSATVHFAVGGIWEYTAESEPGVKYLWWFGDFEATTDANGNHLGYHDFCALRVVVSD